MAEPLKTSAHGLTYPFEHMPAPGEALEIADGIFWLRFPIPYALDHINLWLLRDGDGWTVVDSCVDMDSTRRYWEQIFEITMQGKPVKRVIITHMHPDHVGLAGWLTKKFDAQFMMSRTDYLMCRALVADTGRKAPEEGMRFYRAAGFSDDSLAVYQSRFGSFGEAVHPLPQAYIRLKQGDEIKIGDNMWRIEVGSGHTPEHLCLYCPERKLLISGDQILPRISSNISLFPTEPRGNPLQDWLDSCIRLRDVIPNDTLVLPAHNEPFYGVHERLTALIDGHEKGLARLLNVCDEPRRAVDKEVFSTLFKRPITRETYFMATGESLAHLICLVHRKDLQIHEDENGVCYFQKRNA